MVIKRGCPVGAVKNMRVRKRFSENSKRSGLMSRSAMAYWSVSRPIITGTVLLLAGCASVPDVVNPVEWYKDVKEVVAGDQSADSKSDEKPENRLVADRNKPAPGADEPTPSLSTVPQRPKTLSRIELRRIEKGLVADRTNSRRYSSDVIRRQGESANSVGSGSKKRFHPHQCLRHRLKIHLPCYRQQNRRRQNCNPRLRLNRSQLTTVCSKFDQPS